nr:DMT family transporter [Deefgea sp. CFH1-16]
MPNYAIYAKLALVSLIWGGTFVAGRYLSADVPPLLSACLRFFLASMTLIIVISIKNNLIIELSKSQILRLITLGFFGVFLYNVFFFYGLHYTDASRASLIVALNPALIALTAFFIEKEKISRTNLIGIMACVIGATTVILSKNTSITHSSSELWKGDLLILGCVISWVIYTVFAQKNSFGNWTNSYRDLFCDCRYEHVIYGACFSRRRYHFSNDLHHAKTNIESDVSWRHWIRFSLYFVLRRNTKHWRYKGRRIYCAQSAICGGP